MRNYESVEHLWFDNFVYFKWLFRKSNTRNEINLIRTPRSVGNNYSEVNFQDKIVIIVGSDKNGIKYNEQWSFTLYDSLKSMNRENDVRFLPVADLQGVPFFLRKIIKNKFPEEKN